MAQQEEPLYDFPEPSQPSEQKFSGHQRGQGSLKSISVLDRLLLTVPVWLHLSINPATALHILQREPPGTFIVRKSSTSKRNVLCVRLVDDSVPSFVQQFDIREEHSTLSLVTSAISFPDLPRLISFYCVSRDVLPFPLELPEAIAKATSHKELESISHMGIEFWSSHLNVRGPREPPKPQKEKRPETATSAAPPPGPQSSTAGQLGSTRQPDLDSKPATAPGSDCTQSGLGPTPASTPTLFHEFCPITTRSPRELDCGSGLGALCFINPLFLQSQSVLSRRRMLKHSLKVRLSTETSTLLSPPLAPPPPPPLMPKTKGKCKPRKQGASQHGQKDPGLLHCQNPSQATDILPSSQNAKLEPPTQEPFSESQVQPSANFQLRPAMQAQVQGVEFTAQLPTVTEHLPEESDYMQPSPSLFPGSLSPIPPSLFPKVSQTLSPHDSPCPSPSISPYDSPSLTPKAPIFLSPHASPTNSPYQSPSPSPKVPFTPLPSAPWPQLTEETYHTPAPLSRPDKATSMSELGATGRSKDENMDEDNKTDKQLKESEQGVEGLVLQIDTASLKDTETPLA